MTGWAQLRLWQAEPLDELLAEIDHDERVAQEQSEALDDSAAAIDSSGLAADAARAKVTALRDKTDQLEALLTDFQTATQAAAAGVRAIVERVKACYDYAQTHDLVLTDDGTVLLGQEIFVRAQFELEIARKLNPAATLEQQASYVAGKSAQAELERTIAEVINTAESVDRAFARALEHINDDNVSDAAQLMASANGEAIDPKALWGDDTPAAEVRAQWETLSPAEQAALIQQHPEFIGQLNGIPFDRRVEANDINIAHTRELTAS